MGGAGDSFRGCTSKKRVATFVMFMTLDAGRNQDRRVQESFHGFRPSADSSRSLRTRRIVSRTIDAFKGVFARKTHTPCFLYIDPVARTGRKTTWSSNDSNSSVSPGSSCNCSRTGFGRTNRPARSMLSLAFIMVLYHVYYHFVGLESSPQRKVAQKQRGMGR